MNNTIVKKLEGKVTVNSHVHIETPGGEIVLPHPLTQKLMRRLGIRRDECNGLNSDDANMYLAMRLEEELQHRDYYVRGTGQEWFGLVTSKFAGITADQIRDALTRLHVGGIVEQQFHPSMVHVPLSGSLGNLYAFIDLGKYGNWGGNGESAVKYGISWYNGLCTNWTLFLHKEAGVRGKIIHLKDNEHDLSLEALAMKLEALSAFGKKVEERVEASKDIPIDGDVLTDYLMLYENRGLNKQLATALRERPAQTIYDLAYDMTLLCQHMTKTPLARKRVELLAGELLIAYPTIRETVLGKRIERYAMLGHLVYETKNLMGHSTSLRQIQHSVRKIAHLDHDDDIKELEKRLSFMASLQRRNKTEKNQYASSACAISSILNALENRYDGALQHAMKKYGDDQ
ncbi:hypothetical protein HY639_01185 [Candidatus Woesearchaeota archaeon]|nr:hypothetical protein [Candidatus Woesearchaeota archaeon]